MKIIAVTQRVDFIPQYEEVRDSLDQRWHNFLIECDLIPLIIPNNIELAKTLLQKIKIDGILLTGGNDDDKRKLVENFLIDHALENKLPLLGVCHGMQAVQSHFGLKLYPVTGHVQKNQCIEINAKEEHIDSYHEQGTLENHPDFSIFAQAKDGVIKGIQHKSFILYGIMWHPERISPFAERDINLVRTIFR